MAKQVKAVVKLQVQAGQANPSPPVGTALGPHGIATADFCKQFNDQTKDMGGDIIPVTINIYDDRSFSFTLSKPPAAFLIKKKLNLKKGAGNALTEKVGKLTKDQLKEIAEEKMDDLNANDLDAAMNIIAGTAKNMGVEVEK